MPSLSDLAAALAGPLDAARYAAEGDPSGVWLATERDVRRLGVRLDAGLPPYPWARDLDAVVVHRPFGLWPARLPPGLGVLAYHRALDERLAPGYDAAFAAALGVALDPEPLWRDGRAVGQIGTWAVPIACSEAVARVEACLGGSEAADGPEPTAVTRVALAGAMTEALVEAAAERGAELYVTGQLRGPGRAALGRCGVRALAVGQVRTETWGLRRLAGLVAAAFPDVEIVGV